MLITHVLRSRTTEYIEVEMKKGRAQYLSALSATLYVMVNMMKGGGRATPTLNSLGVFFSVPKAAVATLCVLCAWRTMHEE
jgi:hypothetical protein